MKNSNNPAPRRDQGDEDHPEIYSKQRVIVTELRFKPGKAFCACGADSSRWFVHRNGKTVICPGCDQDVGEAYGEIDF